MRIIPKNTKVSTEFFKGVTLADMIVGFFGVLIVFLIAISSLPHRGYIALGFGFVFVFLLVRIDDESNYLFLFRIIRHFSYYRSYRKPGFEYPEESKSDNVQEIVSEDANIQEEPQEMSGEMTAEIVAADEETKIIELDTVTPEISSDVSGDMLVLEKENILSEQQEEKNPLNTELEEDGFEILDLDEVSVERKISQKPIDTYANVKEKHRKVFGKR